MVIFMYTLTKMYFLKSFIAFKKNNIMVSNANIFADIQAQKKSFTACLERCHSSIGTIGKRFFRSNSVLFIHCYKINYSKTQQLKTAHVVVACFCESGIQAWFSSLLAECLEVLQSKFETELRLHTKT